MREAKPFAENKGLADRDHRPAEDQIVASLRGLAVAGIAAMHDALAHPFQNRFAARESFRGAADHEGQSRGLGAGDPAGDRRIKRSNGRRRRASLETSLQGLVLPFHSRTAWVAPRWRLPVPDDATSPGPA